MVNTIIMPANTICKEKFSPASQKMNALLADAVRSAENEKAVEVLTSLGFKGIIPGTGCSTLQRVSDFYGVEAGYIRRNMPRYGLTHKAMPDDIIRATVPGILARHHVRERYQITGSLFNPCTCRIQDKDTGKNIEIKGIHNNHAIFLSARVILMLPCYFRQGRTIPKNSKVLAVFQRLHKTSYYDAALEAQQKEEQNMEKQQMVLFGADGAVTMQSDVFSKIISESISAGVSNGMSGVQTVLEGLIPLMREIERRLSEEKSADRAASKHTSAARKREFPKTLTKPANWEDVVAMREKGEITLKEAARLTGMHENTFVRHTTGGKPFRTEK